MREAYPETGNTRHGRTSVTLGRRSVAAVLLLLAVTSCSPPDYSAIRDWADSADLAVGYPPAIAPCQAIAGHGTAPGTPDPRSNGVHAMQQALATYLSALATLAADGTLPYREDPFIELKQRAAAASKEGADAIATLGGMLRKATIDNDQAPQLGAMIKRADESVQALIKALLVVVPEIGAHAASGQSALQDGRRAVAPRDTRIAHRMAIRSAYLDALAQVAWGHTVLRQRASRLSQEETARLVHDARNRLVRTEAPLPALFVVAPGGIGCSSPSLSEAQVYGNQASAAPGH
jgi:hypothetical protein